LNLSINPAVIALKERRGQLGNVSQIIIRRMGPFPSQIKDTGVILDLAVHDFDLIRILSGSEIKSMYGLSSQLIHKDKEDSVVCIGETENGVMITIIQNWTTPTKIRDLTMHGDRGMFRVDLLTQDLTFYENNYTSAEWREMGIFRGVSEGGHTQYKIDRKEPLKLEIEEFLRCVGGGTKEVGASAVDGLIALRLAERLQSVCNHE